MRMGVEHQMHHLLGSLTSHMPRAGSLVHFSHCLYFKPERKLNTKRAEGCFPEPLVFAHSSYLFFYSLIKYLWAAVPQKLADNAEGT